MPAAIDSSMKEALLARLRFYRDLGLTEFYRRPVDPALVASAVEPTSEILQENEPISSRKPIPAPPAVTTLIKPADKAAALRLIQDDIGECTRCALHTGRHTIVFADGSPNARLMFVGEGPGADEDAQGLPFVGRAGQLLNNMITAMGLKREEVYIANVVKCRPPGNRTPEPDEMEICGEFLYRQLMAIRPKAICALGGTAVRALTGSREGVTRLRGRWQHWRDIPLMITYHPSYLLRPYNQSAKREAWEDLKKLLHYVYD